MARIGCAPSLWRSQHSSPKNSSKAYIHPGAPLKITIFGLTISSSWGNGHATPYRAILRALHRQGVRVSFYEKDVSYYAGHRDFSSCKYCDLHFYEHWQQVRSHALDAARESDIVITASYCPEGARIIDDVLELDRPLRVFYDLDTPITLGRLASGGVEYLRQEQIAGFDLYLSFTGGAVLERLERTYRARLARPLYGCVDPDVYHRVPVEPEFACWLSYLGTYAADRQDKLEALFLQPAREREQEQLLLAGSLYPGELQLPANVARFEHVAPKRHPALYSSSRATLNLTRREMAESGYCPSGRFFEAAACGTPILSDWWEGLDSFFDPWRELYIVRTAEDVISALESPDQDLRLMADRARARTLEEHTGERRAAQLLQYCEEARRQKSNVAEVMA